MLRTTFDKYHGLNTKRGHMRRRRRQRLASFAACFMLGLQAHASFSGCVEEESVPVMLLIGETLV